MLVPVDLTATADRALGRVPLLPLVDEARVTLLHVVPETLPPRDQRNAERDADKVLADEARHLRKALPKNVTIETMVRLGAAAKEIGACATKVRAELIVMGRGSGRPLRDAFLGSTAERVVRQTKLPVLVVRVPPRAAYDRPALALELDQAAHDVVRLMLRVLPPPRPRIEVIHAYDFPYRGLLYRDLSEEEAEEKKLALRLDATAALAKLLATALTKAKVPPKDAPPWKTHVRCGAPRIIIEKLVSKNDCDLLVLGTRGYSGAAYAFLGSVAGDVLRQARCDVLVVPPAVRSRMAD